MSSRMLIDASHKEETRVVVVRGNRIDEFDFESEHKKQLRGNIYLAKVTRVEPSLQAAFVEYGGNRHGFLAFSEIHPDYYQIPVADRQALLAADEAAAREDDEDENGHDSRNRKRKPRGGRRGKDGGKPANGREMAAKAGDDGDAISDPGETPLPGIDAADAETDEADDHHDEIDAPAPEEVIESVGSEDALEEVPDRRRVFRKQYKIQEVIKRRQIMLVQVVKEERGNKGAALTTYMSLAGRYSVLMPNTARGGGISRKITSVQDRKRLKDVVKELDVPKGMGVILRTAGANRTKAEVKRDYEYLMRLWDNVRTLTLESTAPTLVYEEGSLIKRSIRDLYNKDIAEVLVAGDEAYKEAKSFMRMLMPSHAKVVQPYREETPIFARNGIESQLDKLLQQQVTLKSGGYIIINQTEALVSIDVNSGRSTREHSIEDTALQTNLEAAEEVARQLRLRDLAGLIVIDFIDMEEKRNNRSVEKRLKDCLKNDRARIQVGRISHFGLLEMSRQRIRASVLESTMETCPHCGGLGHVRSASSVALHVIRAIEDYLLRNGGHHITVRTSADTALYVLNHKRETLVDMEHRFGLRITVAADHTVAAQMFAIDRGEISDLPRSETARTKAVDYVDEPEEEIEEIVEEIEAETDAAEASKADAQESDDARRGKRKRRRRRGRGREADGARDGEASEEPGEEAEDKRAGGDDRAGDGDQRRRRRGRRGGRRHREFDQDGDSTPAAEPVAFDAILAEIAAREAAEEEASAKRSADKALRPEAEPVAFDTTEAEAADTADAENRTPRRGRGRRDRRGARADAAPAAVESASPSKGDSGDAVDVPAPEVVAMNGANEESRAEAANDSDDKIVIAEATVTETAESAPRTSAARRRADAPIASEPVVISQATEQAEAVETTEAKPKKAGWWSRKGFF